MKHTKGPWFVECQRTSEGEIVNLQVMANYELVAVLEQDDNANAHLIAAAPDLYAALREITLDSLDPEGEKFDRAMKAIARAEGRE